MKICKRKLVAIIMLLYILLSLITIPIIFKIDYILQEYFSEIYINQNVDTYIEILLLYFSNFKIFIFSTIVNILIIWFLLNIFLTIKKTKIESIGVKFKAEDGTFGTASWMNTEELIDSFDIGTRNGLIVGKINNEIITLPDRAMQNRNVAVFGASGSKKSRRICYSKHYKFS